MAAELISRAEPKSGGLGRPIGNLGPFHGPRPNHMGTTCFVHGSSLFVSDLILRRFRASGSLIHRRGAETQSFEVGAATLRD